MEHFYQEVLKHCKDKKIKEKIIKIENEIKKRLTLLHQELSKEGLFKNYIICYGITGPMARGEATIFFDKRLKNFFGSDLDFGFIVNQINPKKMEKTQNIIINTFKDVIEAGGLFFYKNIYVKPDLMFFEFTNSGYFILNKPKRIIKIEEVPKWEGIRLLNFRTTPFLSYINFNPFELKDSFKYAFIKAITGIGEAFLLLDNLYVANNKKRNALIKKSESLKEIKNFIKMHNIAYEYRYYINNKLEKIDKKLLFEYAIYALKKAWKIFLERYFNKNINDALKELNKIKAPWPTILATRLFYIKDNLLKYKKLVIPIKEPFIVEINKTLEFLNIINGMINNNSLKEGYSYKKLEQKKRELIRYWKTTHKFYLSK